ncbi:MAG: hypothetical protein ABL907_19585 [Hyphomicrobium sp.]
MQPSNDNLIGRHVFDTYGRTGTITEDHQDGWFAVSWSCGGSGRWRNGMLGAWVDPHDHRIGKPIERGVDRAVGVILSRDGARYAIRWATGEQTHVAVADLETQDKRAIEWAISRSSVVVPLRRVV